LGGQSQPIISRPPLPAAQEKHNNGSQSDRQLNAHGTKLLNILSTERKKTKTIPNTDALISTDDALSH
jgi:hypothetical protein